MERERRRQLNRTTFKRITPGVPLFLSLVRAPPRQYPLYRPRHTVHHLLPLIPLACLRLRSITT